MKSRPRQCAGGIVSPLGVTIMLKHCSVAAILIASSSSLAQEQKRPERMEAAVGPEGASAPSAARVERPRIPGLMLDGTTVLHNQWSLSPAGSHVELGDFPALMTLRPSGKVAAVLHCGHGTHEVAMVSLETKAVLCRVSVPQSFYGLCFSPDGNTLFASGGEYELVHAWNVDADGLLSGHREMRSAPAKESFVVTGLATSVNGEDLYVCGAWG
ncbi:MAG: YncE family protein, partial [Phycisphaerales bacterium]